MELSNFTDNEIEFLVARELRTHHVRRGVDWRRSETGRPIIVVHDKDGNRGEFGKDYSSCSLNFNHPLKICSSLDALRKAEESLLKDDLKMAYVQYLYDEKGPQSVLLSPSERARMLVKFLQLKNF